ncbi:MAG: TetR/AcrR family transcriptional regulator [Cytophagales bacterium]|nr:TetR/AcrR family transcriptional regulator [Cytophagales bacterium]
MGTEQTTEEKILAAAEEVFLQSGFDGARMQEIANKAEINKAMLHYYFRSKDLLFERIFEEKARYFFPEVNEIFAQENSFEQKIHSFIEKYIHFINQHPYIPIFIITTINRKGQEVFIDKLPLKASLAQNLFTSYFKDFQEGKVAEINPLQLALSVIGMCVFPYLGRPILNHVFKIQGDEFFELMEARIQEVQLYVSKILKVD